MDAFGGSFRGILEKEKTEIKGKWDMQGMGPGQIKTTFTRVTEESEPAPPVDYSFSQEDLNHIRGFWKGSIKPRPGMEITMILRLGQLSDGFYRGAMDIPNQAAENIPLTSVDYSHPGVIAKWSTGKAEFILSLTDDFMSLNGDMKQNGMKFPIAFVRHHPEDLKKVNEVLSFESPEKTPDVRGNWESILKVPNAEIRLDLAIGKNEKGEFRSFMSMVDQGLNKLPASETLFKATELTIRWSGIGHSFEGRFSEDGRNLVGSWKMGPLSSDLTFNRKEQP
ncbi:MAG TPA: hypothetical protein EYQ50_05775 [Verrucomicrobiales bacterium]|nr:hypothetical protein [Verrucomicrobiales bacterium]